MGFSKESCERESNILKFLIFAEEIKQFCAAQLMFGLVGV
jgi:hypothetical protein